MAPHLQEWKGFPQDHHSATMASSGSATGMEIRSQVAAKVSFESIVGVNINEAIDLPELIQREVDVEVGGEVV